MHKGIKYLTKRLVLSATRRGVKAASKSTIEAMGYNVVAKNGWVVKEFRDGKIERIKPIKHPGDLGPVSLD